MRKSTNRNCLFSTPTDIDDATKRQRHVYEDFDQDLAFAAAPVLNLPPILIAAYDKIAFSLTLLPSPRLKKNFGAVHLDVGTRGPFARGADEHAIEEERVRG